MLKRRLIPCLLLRNGGLVKTIKFSNPKYVGDPINAIHIFNEKEVDELIVLDITASKEKREPNYDLIERIAGECFMPLCYGGGIRTIEQARHLFKLGVEKISIQTAALHNLSIIKQISEEVGSQSVVASIDVLKNKLGKYLLYSSSRGKTHHLPWTDYLNSVVEAGAGEIVLNAVDNDGMMKGMDLELIRRASINTSVPLIAIGGAGSLSHLKSAFESGASAVAAGSFFVFQGPHRAVLITYPSQIEIDQLFNL
jgi:cyclase